MLLSCCNWSKQERWLFLMLLPTSCNGCFSLGFSPASRGTFQLLSSATLGRPLFLCDNICKWSWACSRIYPSSRLVASLNKRSPSYFKIMFPNLTLPCTGEPRSGIHPILLHLLFSPLCPKQAGLYLVNTLRKADVRLGWCLVRRVGWPSQGPGCPYGTGAKISSKHTFF